MCVCVCLVLSKVFLGSLNQQQQQLQLAPLMTITMCWVEAFSAASLGKPAPWTTDKTKLNKSTKISRASTHTTTTTATTLLCKAIPPAPLFPLSALARSYQHSAPFSFKAQVHMQILKSFAATFFTCTNYKKCMEKVE